MLQTLLGCSVIRQFLLHYVPWAAFSMLAWPQNFVLSLAHNQILLLRLWQQQAAAAVGFACAACACLWYLYTALMMLAVSVVNELVAVYVASILDLDVKSASARAVHDT
jgi:hypothetical protein